jgi:hypothetical protein
VCSRLPRRHAARQTWPRHCCVYVRLSVTKQSLVSTHLYNSVGSNGVASSTNAQRSDRAMLVDALDDVASVATITYSNSTASLVCRDGEIAAADDATTNALAMPRAASEHTPYRDSL